MISSDCHTAIVSGQGFIETVKSLDMAACDSPRDVSLSIGGAALLCFLFFFFFRFRIRQLRRHKSEPAIINFNYNYEVFQEATEGFCAANKLGQGGFAEVYKGTLKDGKEIVVKKLFVTQSTQAMEEFLTEIKIVSGFLHRNLIRLLGCCSKGQERFLVYEFMPNRSLDQHLFGEGGIHLKWIDRFKIITGTARGLVYLHEQSHFPIVHRDIKTPNILLDENLQPKIADFGLAKFFPEDKTHLTTRVGGTIGYTAPEYAVHGLLTQKVDVYSYGVIVLETVSGKKCSNTGIPHPMELLLQWAWNSYETNESLSIADPKLQLETLSENEQRQILRVIHIALLCTQGSPTKRPSMFNVLSMLTNDSEISGLPTPPALLDLSKDLIPTPRPVIAGTSSSTLGDSSSTSHGSISVSLFPR
ncbi:hypothetical protein SUGI_0790860 [Cryptomeria japonica]|nr:hypothetical protein SUGI_0790860 [Cryptomeria japonica]